MQWRVRGALFESWSRTTAWGVSAARTGAAKPCGTLSSGGGGGGGGGDGDGSISDCCSSDEGKRERGRMDRKSVNMPTNTTNARVLLRMPPRCSRGRSSSLPNDAVLSTSESSSAPSACCTRGGSKRRNATPGLRIMMVCCACLRPRAIC